MQTNRRRTTVFPETVEVVHLRADFEIFFSLLTDAFSPDPLEALDGSVALAKRCGVPDDEILSGIPEIDRYFLS